MPDTHNTPGPATVSQCNQVVTILVYCRSAEHKVIAPNHYNLPRSPHLVFNSFCGAWPIVALVEWDSGPFSAPDDYWNFCLAPKFDAGAPPSPLVYSLKRSLYPLNPWLEIVWWWCPFPLLQPNNLSFQCRLVCASLASRQR